jgi:hypothetical protein|tara:strand:+ start:812 stop:1075 length:264 start_codon:yes stop_codon:yes gene_type:complete
MQRKKSKDVETSEKVPEEQAEELRPVEERSLGEPEVIHSDIAVPVIVLTTRDHYILAAMQGVLATKSNISPEDLRSRCEKIADEFLG